MIWLFVNGTMFLIALFDGGWLRWLIFGLGLVACFLDVAYVRPLRNAERVKRESDRTS